MVVALAMMMMMVMMMSHLIEDKYDDTANYDDAMIRLMLMRGDANADEDHDDDKAAKIMQMLNVRRHIYVDR